MTRPQVFAAVFFALLAVLLYHIGLILLPFLVPALWAGLLAHWMFPLHRRVTQALAGRAALSAGCLAGGAFVGVIVPVVWLGLLLIGESGAIEQALREWLAGGGMKRLPEQLAAVPLVGSWLASMVTSDRMQHLSFEESVLTGAKWISGLFVDRMAEVLKNAVMVVSNFFIMVLVLFFLLKEGERWLAALYELIPMEESHKRRIVARLDQTVRAVMKGVFVTALVQGLLAGAAYAVLGVPFALVLTVLTILLAPIPLGGTALVWGPVSLYLLAIGATGKGLGLLVWGVAVVSTIDQVLRPWLIGQEVQIPTLLLVLSVLGGLASYGLLGLFIGPILVSLFLTAIQIYREEYHAAPASSPPAG